MSPPSSAQSARTTSFDLVLPPDPDLLRVVRLVASGLASLTPLDLDAVEEVRVAADELVSTLMQASAGGPVTVSFAVADELLRVSGSTQRAEQSAFEPDPLTERILDEVSTAHTWQTDGFELTGQIEHALGA